MFINLRVSLSRILPIIVQSKRGKLVTFSGDEDVSINQSSVSIDHWLL